MVNEIMALYQVLKCDNWREILTNKGIRINHEVGTPYSNLKYASLDCDFSDPVVRACRGAIIKEGKWFNYLVAMPMLKFFNATEPHAAIIDWATATVSEKVDGSCLIVWWDDGKWHLSTLGTPNAFKCECYDGVTFGDLFMKAIGGNDFQKWCDLHLDTFFTYYFELTSPLNQVVIHYDDTRIWWLGRRDMLSLVEDTVGDDYLMSLRPRQYGALDYEQCVAQVGRYGEDQEGVVVCDSNFNRVKIKGEAYLALHRLVLNGNIGLKKLVYMICDGSIDDFLAYRPAYVDKVNAIKGFIGALTAGLRNELEEMRAYEGDEPIMPKDWAPAIQRFKWNNALAWMWVHNHQMTAGEFVRGLRASTLYKLIKENMKEEGV